MTHIHTLIMILLDSYKFTWYLAVVAVYVISEISNHHTPPVNNLSADELRRRHADELQRAGVAEVKFVGKCQNSTNMLDHF